jgi:tRNA 5-methylaminomethyl-2-thiouridine biosynthesis bifunctional protein
MQFATLQWNNQQPYSLDFDDVYYSSEDGLAETEYVFIKHNQLTERFSNLQDTEFTIIETGFGTGLNFFCAIQNFIKHAPASASCRFISIERYPLRVEDLIKANQSWPMLGELATQLHAPYTKLKDGLNTFHLCQNRIQLDLWIGDVSECLQQIQTTADAWFLDGFSPAKNSDMWSEALFAEIAKLSKSNTTFATFTSAGQVRRQLEAVGFVASKVAGFGKKREMLYGAYR